MNNKQLRQYVIRPVLMQLGMYSPEAENLIAGTIAQESAMGEYIHQINGPALGICQVEPSTHDDIWENFIAYRPELQDILFDITPITDSEEMIHNLNYAVAMCRIHYYRVPDAIPCDIVGQAEYWKKWYNTEQGRGTTEEYIYSYARYAEN